MIKQITELQALAQSGLAYCKDEFDIERYNRIIAIAAELFTFGSKYKLDEIFKLFRYDAGYATPKIGVRGAVFQNNKLLLVQERNDQLWSLPGGWSDVNLSPSENIEKEVLEETGFACKAAKLISIFDKKKDDPNKWPHVYELLFMCELGLCQQKAFDQKEVIDVGFFDLANIPGLSSDRTSYRQIELCFQYLHNPLLPAFFD